MPCVKAAFSTETNQLLLPVNFFDPKTSKVSREDGKITVSGGKLFQCLALVDTGATRTCITQKIADFLDMLPEGEREVFGVHGSQKTMVYSVSLVVPQIVFLQEAMPVFRIHTQPENGYDALLGMDVLSKGNFQLDFSGNFVFCI